MVEDLVVGDRVTRPKDLFEDRAIPTLRRGVVVEVYQDTMSHTARVLTLYKVCWDDTGLSECGYMRLGLTKEATVIA